MAQIGNTQAAAKRTEQWDASLLQARYAAAKIMARFLNKSELVSGKGYIAHITVEPKFSGGTVASDGEFTPEQQTLTDVQVTIDTWQYVSLEIPDDTDATTLGDLKKKLPQNFGKRLQVLSDQAIANLYTNLTTNVGLGSAASPAVCDDDLVRAAPLKLADLDVPQEDVSFILPPVAWWKGLFKYDKFTLANATGFSKGVQTNGFKGSIYGFPGYETTSLNSPNANCTVGLFAHKETFAYAHAINNRRDSVRGVANYKLVTIEVIQQLYGVKTVRENHGAPLFISKTGS